MTKAAKVQVGYYVSYFVPLVVGPPRVEPHWTAAKITSVIDQNNLVLATVTNTGTRVPINGGAPVPRRTAHGQTNVWRPN